MAVWLSFKILRSQKLQDSKTFKILKASKFQDLRILKVAKFQHFKSQHHNVQEVRYTQFPKFSKSRTPIISICRKSRNLDISDISKSTGPPMQSTGPPRTDAGVGIGYVKGGLKQID